MVLAGMSGRVADSPNSQATSTTKAGLRNSDGWMFMPKITSQRRAPLISAPNSGVSATRTEADGEDDDGEPADLARIEEGDAQHHRDGRDEIEDVAVDEVERVEAEPGGDRRAGGQRQHDAGQHQRAEGGERELVDRPPPLGKGRALRARDHEFPVRGAS